MHISKASKALFLLANHITASIIPPHLKIARLNTGNNEDTTTTDVSLTGRSVNPGTIPPALLSRQQEESCDACRDRCPLNKIIHPKDCQRCTRCPKGQKADPTFRTCIPGQPGRDEEDKEKRKEDREKKYQNTKTIKKQDHKLTKYDSKKEKEKNKYQENEKRKQDNERRKKVRRAGRCLPLVAVAMGADAAAEFADEFFDEAYLESMDLEQFWPEDLPIEPWDTEESDKIFEEDEYVDKFLEVGNGGGGATVATGIVIGRRGGDVEGGGNGTAKVGGQEGRATDLIEISSGEEDLEERFWFLIPIFMAVATTAARVGAAAARVGGAVLKVSRYTVKMGKGRSSKKSYKDQSEGARKIAQNKNWRKCLGRGNPEK